MPRDRHKNIDKRLRLFSYKTHGEVSRSMAIQHQVRQKYRTRNEEIVAKLRDDAGAAPPIDPYMKVKRLTAQIAVEMALIHGGYWAAHVDHQNGLVAVARRHQPGPTGNL